MPLVLVLDDVKHRVSWSWWSARAHASPRAQVTIAFHPCSPDDREMGLTEDVTNQLQSLASTIDPNADPATKISNLERAATVLAGIVHRLAGEIDQLKQQS